MTVSGWLQIGGYLLVLGLTARPLGHYLAKVFGGERTCLDRWLHPLERLLYRLCGVDPEREMHWSTYATSVLAFSVVATMFSYVIMRLQGRLPWNPMGLSTAQAPTWATALTPDLAFNTAVSFATNTNWQAYGGESTMSYLSQMLALSFHNWVSAAAGIAAAVALVRGFARRQSHGIGNFWADLVRCTLYVLAPLVLVSATFMVSQGVPQNLSPYVTATTLEGASQTIPMGPMASQEAIKMLGTNGGGFLNANSAHPFGNPTPLTNFLQVLMIFSLGSGLLCMFGVMVKDVRQGWALWAACAVWFLAGVSTIYLSETAGNPQLAARGALTSVDRLGELGGNYEGKEVRFGQAGSALFADVTTCASCGAVNCLHDSFTPLAGLVPLINIQADEIIFGGVGSGLYGLLVYAVLALFIGGLMVGRTPEYLGKKIEARDVKLATVFILLSSFVILAGTATATVAKFPAKGYWNSPGAAAANVNNGGPHGLTEILYAYTSAAGNNGSAFAGINVNTPFYNLTLGLAMLFGRFFMMVPALGLAGSLASKKYTPPSAGTFPTHGALFVLLLLSVIVIVTALTYFPVLSLGPIIEHLLMNVGKVF